MKASVVHRSNVVGSIYRSASPRGLDEGRGVRRLIGKVGSFYTLQRRRNGPGVSLASFLSRVTLLASRSSSGTSSKRGVALVAIRSTGKLRFGGMFIIKLRRGLFPDKVTKSSPHTLRRRHHLFCITVAHTRRRYCLSFTGAHFHCKGVRFKDPDHFLHSVSIRCLRLPRRTKIDHSISRNTKHFHERVRKNFAHSTSPSHTSFNDDSSRRHTHPGTRVVTPDIPEGLGGIDTIDKDDDTRSTTSGTTSIAKMHTKRVVRRRHFKLNRIVGIRKAKSGTGTAVRFGGTNSGRLLLHFTHFGIVGWVMARWVRGIVGGRVAMVLLSTLVLDKYTSKHVKGPKTVVTNTSVKKDLNNSVKKLVKSGGRN